jgi:hypothetical protein
MVAMENVLGSIDSQLVVLIAAVAVVILLFNLVAKVLRVGFVQLLVLGGIVLMLNYGFDISPRQLWFEVSHLPTTLMRLVQSFS